MGGGAPKGRAVLLSEALGAKVYRRGSVAGARAWVETDPQGVGGRGTGLELEWEGEGHSAGLSPQRGQLRSSPTSTHLDEACGRG